MMPLDNFKMWTVNFFFMLMHITQIASLFFSKTCITYTMMSHFIQYTYIYVSFATYNQWMLLSLTFDLLIHRSGLHYHMSSWSVRAIWKLINSLITATIVHRALCIKAAIFQSMPGFGVKPGDVRCATMRTIATSYRAQCKSMCSLFFVISPCR